MFALPPFGSVSPYQRDQRTVGASCGEDVQGFRGVKAAMPVNHQKMA